MAEAVPRSLAGNHAATMRRIRRERRRFGEPDQETQHEQGRRRPRPRAESADAALKQREQRPDEDAGEVDRSSSRSGRAASRPESGRARRTSRRRRRSKPICTALRPRSLRQAGPGDGHRGAVGVVDHGDDEQHRHDREADPRPTFVLGRSAVATLELRHLDLLLRPFSVRRGSEAYAERLSALSLSARREIGSVCGSVAG